jgi:ribosome-binding factor A
MFLFLQKVQGWNIEPSFFVMESIKQRQVAEMVKRNFSTILQEEGSYIYGAEPLVTVTNVKMTPDFAMARIYLSVYNTENKQAVLLEMEEERHRLKQNLGARIRKQVRRLPDISFFLDDTLDEMYRIDSLFQHLRAENQMGSEEE